MLTVVVPATDAPATLPRCLAALARCEEPHAVGVVRAATAAALLTAGALALRRSRDAAADLSAMIAANMSFYLLLGRRGGPRLALAGVPLQGPQNLTAALSVPAAVALRAREGRP